MKKILSVVIATSLVLMSGLPAPFVGREKAYAAAPLAPTNLQITTVEDNNRSLTLKWDKTGIGIDSFNVYVDGEFVTSVPNNSSSTSISVTLSDDENTMGKLHEPGEHTISVSSVNTNGEESSKVSVTRAALLYVNKLPYNFKTYVSPSGITVETRGHDSLGQGEWYVHYKYDGVVKYLPTGETVNVFDILGFSNADDPGRYRIEELTNSGKVIIWEKASVFGENPKYYVYDIVNNVFTPINAYGIVANPIDDTALVLQVRYDSTKREFYLTNLQLINLSNPAQVIKNIASFPFPPNDFGYLHYTKMFKIIGNKIYGVFYNQEKYLWYVHDGAGWTRISELSIYPQFGESHQASSPIILAPGRFIYKINTETDQINVVGQVPTNVNHASSVYNLMQGDVWYGEGKEEGGAISYLWTLANPFADPVPLDMPTLKAQESTSHSVRLEFNPVNGAVEYKIKRQDGGVVHTLQDLTFEDNTVLPARQYTYEFWAENGEESPHNSVTLWTKPAEPSMQLVNVSDNSVLLAVDLKDNPADIEIEAIRVGGNPIVNGTEISESGLAPNTSYTYEVRLKSANNEYTAWVSKTIQTTPDPYAPTYDTVKDVTVDMRGDGDVDIGGIKSPNAQLRYSIVVKKSGNVIATSPLFADITELEDWLEGELERNTKYEIVFGAQKGNDASTKVEKTIVLITPPVMVTESNVSVSVTENSATLDTSQIGNPMGTVYEVTVGSKVVTGTNEVTVAGLSPGTTYTASIKVNRPDNTLMFIGIVTFQTKAVVTPPPVTQPVPDDDPVSPPVDEPVPDDELTPEEKFTEEVEEVAATLEYVVDGEPNSGQAYIDIKLETTTLTVMATVDGKTKAISKTPTRFDHLEDNQAYTIVVTFTDGKYTSTKEYTVNTPNRTPPTVENAYTKDGRIILEVISKNGIKQ